MLFQVLDSKKECRAVFIDGQIKEKFNSGRLTHTWSPSAHFFDEGVEYASVWCTGTPIDDACPADLKERWEHINKRAEAFMSSIKHAKIDLNYACIYDLLPRPFLIEYYSLKNDISKFVFENHEKPRNYDFLHDLVVMLKKIESKDLNIEIKNLDQANTKIRHSISKINNSFNKIIYNPWSTVTGRLTTNKSSFPILTLNKELRPALTPNNDIFVELDYNSAELRVLLGLLGEQQPSEDIHTWIGANVFSDKFTRDQVKKKIFAWLYNPKARNKKLNHYFDRGRLDDLFYKNGVIETPYDRTIEAPPEKSVNYLVQSTTSDLFLTSAIKISKMLKHKKSYVAFCIHDSLVLDFSKEDRPIMEEIISVFSKTKFGNFKTNVSMGKNFGALKKIT